MRLSRKREREKFAPKSTHALIEKELLKLDIQELPMTAYGGTETLILHGIPVTRQYFIASSEKLHETKDMVAKNLRLFNQFYNIFIKIKDHLNPETMKPEVIKRQFQRYSYQKPTQEARGLRPV